MNQTAAAKYGATIIAVLVKKNYPLQVALFTLKYSISAKKNNFHSAVFSNQFYYAVSVANNEALLIIKLNNVTPKPFASAGIYKYNGPRGTLSSIPNKIIYEKGAWAL